MYSPLDRDAVKLPCKHSCIYATAGYMHNFYMNPMGNTYDNTVYVHGVRTYINTAIVNVIS